MEDELNTATNKIKNLQAKQNVTAELEDVKTQLAQKTELLDKVKVLLHRAAVKEKALVEEVICPTIIGIHELCLITMLILQITKLKSMVPCSTTSMSSN